ncbi:ChaN family lipoprotein [Pseudohalocynthiibacter aestuariivivens]|nr:ChaN family lipoprotein [Pseudohalocynthiibacter aestuariivivens]QIE46420.1 ChaN family lipoprotein [Pseudohalocynthiibacter aestuariivivens]
MILRIAIVVVLAAMPAVAQDIWVLGEVHDNPDHHQTQAEMTTEIAPAALVFEMLTPDQSRAALPALRDDRAALEEALGWSESGWPDFGLYYPIFAAAPAVPVYGAGVPRAMARAAMAGDIAMVFGGQADDYGLTQPLPAEEQTAREALQMEAHCDALPADMLPDMVAIQRLRDASLARAALQAWRDTGGPVVVITGNGHARRDWGATALIARAAPTLGIVALGQGEDGVPPDGVFDRVTDAPAPAREDNCAAFR